MSIVQTQTILFIDDELFFAQPYVDELERLAPVTLRTAALEAVDEFTLRSNSYLCAVVDVMLPPPSGWDDKTKEGLDTGLEVLRRCGDDIVKAQLPIIVLTHRAKGYVQGEIDLIGFPGGLVELQSKLETPPFHLAIVVKRLVRKWKGISL